MREIVRPPLRGRGGANCRPIFHIPSISWIHHPVSTCVYIILLLFLFHSLSISITMSRPASARLRDVDCMHLSIPLELLASIFWGIPFVVQSDPANIMQIWHLESLDVIGNIGRTYACKMCKYQVHMWRGHKASCDFSPDFSMPSGLRTSISDKPALINLSNHRYVLSEASSHVVPAHDGTRAREANISRGYSEVSLVFWSAHLRFTFRNPITLSIYIQIYSKRKVSGSSSPTNSGATLCGQESAPLFLAHGEFARTS